MLAHPVGKEVFQLYAIPLADCCLDLIIPNEFLLFEMRLQLKKLTGGKVWTVGSVRQDVSNPELLETVLGFKTPVLSAMANTGDSYPQFYHFGPMVKKPCSKGLDCSMHGDCNFLISDQYRY